MGMEEYLGLDVTTSARRDLRLLSSRELKGLAKAMKAKEPTLNSLKKRTPFKLKPNDSATELYVVVAPPSKRQGRQGQPTGTALEHVWSEPLAPRWAKDAEEL